ncbi:MAG: twin-arginine translocase TatA/TatE family subunit [Deltaproteobacteria bacterium]|nr:twin-arginine translocase TatA/TatE family subunit [Deltaproteobacteria bacterium]
MFGIGAQELILIAVVALLIVGPKKLPDMARSLGKGFREFKKTADDVNEGIKDSLSVPDTGTATSHSKNPSEEKTENSPVSNTLPEQKRDV